jgi:hypothetical protein
MIIPSPKNRLQLRFGKTAKQMSLSPPLSGITHNGCLRATIGIVANEMLTSIPNFILTKKKPFHFTPKKWFYGTLYHSFTFSFNSQETKFFDG